MKTAFSELPVARQLLLLRELAERALPHWGLEHSALELLKHRENTVFEVRAPTGTRYVMRVHREHYHSDAALESELLWLEELRRGGVATTRAVRCLDQRCFAWVDTPELPAGRQVDLLDWVPGEAIGSVESGVPLAMPALQNVYRQAGEQIARIHNIGESWARPAGFERLAWDERGFYGESGSICGCYRDLESLTPAHRELLDRARDRCDKVLADFGKTPDRFGLVHGDLLPENLFWDGDTLRLIDWDDTGFGWYLYDFATALFPHLGAPAFDPVLGALVAGYREHRRMPDEHLLVLPVVIMARALSYVGWAHSRATQAGELTPLIVAVACQLAEDLLDG